jgi:spore maturation protein CgeB
MVTPTKNKKKNIMELIVYCDDFENAPREKLEYYECEQDMLKRMAEIDAELVKNRFAYERGYDVVKIIEYPTSRD